MKVLIADQFDDAGLAELRSAGCDVLVRPGLKDGALTGAIRESRCAVLVVRSTKVTAPMIEASDALALVVRAGAGYNTIDVEAASRRSVFVANCPGKNAVAVAELTLGLILALDRRIVEGTNDLAAGRWNKKLYAQAAGLKDRTLGVVGLGQIGLAVVRRAQAFEMNVLAWSRSLDDGAAAELGVTRCGSIEEAAHGCDILSVHLALTPETKGRINAGVFDRLKAGAYFINTARAEIVDHAALIQAVEGKKLRVGLDVFPDEPTDAVAVFSDRILQSGGIVYGTHHIGASTDQAQNAIAAETVRIITTYLRTGRVENCVNLCARSPARYILQVRHRNRPGVLAHTLNAISHAGVNVEEMENVISDGAHAACARIKLDARLDDVVVARIQTGNEHVISVTQNPLSG